MSAGRQPHRPMSAGDRTCERQLLPPADAADRLLDRDCDWVLHGDNLHMLPLLPSGDFGLVYIDPPFNTGHTRQAAAGSYEDRHDGYLDWIAPRLREARRLLADHGTFYFHIDYREAHYCKVLLDSIFGRDCFLNEIIWAYDWGGRPKRRWPAKHDTILVYVRDPDRYWFDQEAVDPIPYMAPGLQTAERAARGKPPTDVWWHTIVGTRSHERCGYPTQKPEAILRRILQASARPGDRILDFFAGSGTTGAAAAQLEHRFVLIDDNPDAIAAIRRRFAGHDRPPRHAVWDPAVGLLAADEHAPAHTPTPPG